MAMNCSKEMLFEMAKNALEGMGLKQKNNLVYYKQVADGIIGVINLGVKNIKVGESMSINPIVGVVVENVEATFGEITGMNTLPQLMPTISAPLVDIVGDENIDTWICAIDRDNEKVMGDLLSKIQTVGFGFFESRNTLATIIKDVENKRYIAPKALAYKLPLLYHYNNEAEKAKRFLEENEMENDMYFQKLKNKMATLAS